MWQGTGSTNKWNLSSYSLRVQAVLLGFRRFVREGTDSTAAAVTFDTVADDSRKKMADGVARSSSRLCSREGKICCYGDALSTISCLLALVPYFLRLVFLFLFIFVLHQGMFFFVSLCLCSSHLAVSASTYFIMRRASEASVFFLAFPRKKKPLRNGSYEHRVPKIRHKTVFCTRCVCV